GSSTIRPTSCTRCARGRSRSSPSGACRSSDRATAARLALEYYPMRLIPLIPAQAGIQETLTLGPRFRGDERWITWTVGGRAPVDRILQRRDQPVARERLHQVVEGAVPHGLDRLVDRRIGGDDDHAHGRPLPPPLVQQVETVAVRKPEVEERCREAAIGGRPAGLGEGSRLLDGVALGF